MNEEALAHWGLLHQKQTNKQTNKQTAGHSYVMTFNLMQSVITKGYTNF
jgi:hypothetical protein